MKTILVTGNDKIGNRAAQAVRPFGNVRILVDSSTNAVRCLRLLRKKSLSPVMLAILAGCEFMRRGNRPDKCFPRIRSHRDLLSKIQADSPDEIVLFRAGLIIPANWLRLAPRILNIHAANIPEYRGLGAVARALEEGAWEQHACLHEVTADIDDGPVFDRQPYRLNPVQSYCRNEEAAYEAAIQLLVRHIRTSENPHGFR